MNEMSVHNDRAKGYKTTKLVLINAGLFIDHIINFLETLKNFSIGSTCGTLKVNIVNT